MESEYQKLINITNESMAALLGDSMAKASLDKGRLPIAESWSVPIGKKLEVGSLTIVHPHDMLLLRFGGKLPFEEKCNRGVFEAERDRRKYHK